MATAQRDGRRNRRWREPAALSGRDFAAIAALVVALHVALLVALDRPQGRDTHDIAAPRRAPAALQTRVLVPPRPAVAPPPAPATAPAHGAVKIAAPAAPPRAVAVAATQLPAVPAEEDAPTAAQAPVAPAVPIYRTQPPPAFAYAYALQQGNDRGSVELHWSRDGDRYEARLTGALEGAPLLALHSAGGFDAAGLAPLRHTDGRKGRSAQAANFRRDEGRITFSGSSAERALLPGAQDRLSWMIQLAAIAAADPSLVAPGGRIVLAVVGARGDAAVWTFEHVADEALALAGGSTPAIRLLRLPEQAYDTRAEVWLDPARHYLPLRVQLSNPPSARDGLQIEWRGALAERQP